MGFQTITLRISLDRDQFITLLLLHGQVQTMAKIGIVGDEVESITINSSREHKKFGHPGEEEGNHFFTTEVIYKDRYVVANCSVNTVDKGKTFQGSLTFQVYPEDNLSE